MRLWARHLNGARERTVIEGHMTRTAGELWGLPHRRAARSALTAIAGSAGRAPGEPLTQKLGRTRAAIGDAFLPKSEHDERSWALQPPPFDEEGKGA